MVSLIFNVSVGIPGALSRAGFVAALALIAFVLARYWKSLSENTKTNRYVMVGLRGVALLFVACALAGMQIEYEKQLPVQILIHSPITSPANETRERSQSDFSKRVLTSLAASGVEFIEKGAWVREDDNYPAASIFVTDGAMESTNASAEVERAHIASGGGPVFVVSDPEPNVSPRVSINDVAVINRPLLGVPLTVRCMVHARGMRGRATLVTVSDDAEVRASSQVRWGGDDERQVLTLEVISKSAGWINYLARVEGTGGEDPSTTSRPFTIFVEERRQRILFLEGEPTWEAKFIRRVLDNSAIFNVDYFAQVSRAAIVGAGAKESGTEKNPDSTGDRTDPDRNLHAVLSNATKLNIYDCIIVGATPDTLLSKSEATRLLEWVDRRGGGLVILGGNSFTGSVVAPKGKLGSMMPAEIDSGSFRSASQSLARSTPVEAEKSRVGILLSPTETGQASALRGYANALEGSTESGVLSGEGFRLGALRPGATVLAVKGQPGVKGTGENSEPLIVAMRYGAGRSIVFAPADSWRMRTSESGDASESNGPFASLWQGLSLWAASTARPPVEIVLGDESPETANETTAEIRVRDEAFASTRLEKLSGRIQQLGDGADSDTSSTLPSIEVLFFPDPNDSSIWRARYKAPQAGRYHLQINYTANGKTGTAEKRFATVAGVSIETGAGNDTLRRVARKTGGELFSASALTTLRDRLAALPKANRNAFRKLELRSWWPFALIIPLLLSSVWLIERIKVRTRKPVNAF